MLNRILCIFKYLSYGHQLANLKYMHSFKENGLLETVWIKFILFIKEKVLNPMSFRFTYVVSRTQQIIGENVSCNLIFETHTFDWREKY